METNCGEGSRSTSKDNKQHNNACFSGDTVDATKAAFTFRAASKPLEEYDSRRNN
jgi:hypothetical protein